MSSRPSEGGFTRDQRYELLRSAIADLSAEPGPIPYWIPVGSLSSPSGITTRSLLAAVVKNEFNYFRSGEGHPCASIGWLVGRRSCLSVLRIMTALLFLQHPFAKFFKIPHVPMFDNLQLFSLIGISGMIELIGCLAAAARALHASGGLHSRRRDGVRLFHRTRPARFLSADQRRRARRAVLFHLPLYRRSGSGTLERRCTAQTGTG